MCGELTFLMCFRPLLLVCAVIQMMNYLYQNPCYSARIMSESKYIAGFAACCIASKYNYSLHLLYR